MWDLKLVGAAIRLLNKNATKTQVTKWMIVYLGASALKEEPSAMHEDSSWSAGNHVGQLIEHFSPISPLIIFAKDKKY